MALSRATSQIKLAWLSWLTGSLLLALCNQLHANGKIYQLELIVFERSGGALGSGESWQKNIQLEYPDKWQRLLTQEEVAAAQESPPHQSDEFLQTLERERSQPMASTQPSAGPAYFVYLPPEKRSLQNTHNALARRNQYRILFHETWLQPMEAVEKARPLILHGGRQYGDYYELQGTLTVGANRFLHVQTDLWLSEFSTDEYQNNTYGVQLPREPKDQPQEQIQEDWREDSMESLEPKSDYQVNQVIVLQQKRRMRSGELHYLDHPKLGALIKITPQ